MTYKQPSLIFFPTLHACFIFSLQLEPTHTAISEFAGSAMAYKCFGQLLTTFVAGWEEYEMARAYCLVQSISRYVYISGIFLAVYTLIGKVDPEHYVH